MYFLKAALLGIRRRLLSSLLLVVGSSSILLAMAAIGLWSNWLLQQNENMKAHRSVAIFVDSRNDSDVEDVLTKIMQVKGVDSARIISTEEFQSFLSQHFPDLAAAVDGLGLDIIPRSLEVFFSKDIHYFERLETVRTLEGLSGVQRVDDGMDRMASALTSIRWLGLGGYFLLFSLYGVFLFVCVGHYQNLLYSEAQELSLVRSFGATKFMIVLPWIFEGFFQSVAVGLVVGVSLLGGKTYLLEVYNQFFGTVGYDPFHFEFTNLLLIIFASMILSFLAHLFSSGLALLRWRLH
ncbi:MAG: hypothetical protein M9962_11660 [Oligoflexia bacterium]|nr:hypothetical protein [Oligoflexia bacterium]